MDANPHRISVDRLAGSVAAPGAPLLLDVRPAAAFRAEPVLILAVSRGLSALFADDNEMLRHGLVLYDALYAQLCAAEREGRRP